MRISIRLRYLFLLAFVPVCGGASAAVFEEEKRERNRFARDLHDGVNGMLSAIKNDQNPLDQPALQTWRQ